MQAGTWSNALGGGTVNGASLSRANAISYTSPTFGGFSVGASWGENDFWDVALRYAGEFGGLPSCGWHRLSAQRHGPERRHRGYPEPGWRPATERC